MTNSDKSSRWLEYADHETGSLSRHLRRLRSRRLHAVAVTASERESGSLAPLIPIGMLTLFMLWAVINPV